MKLDALLAMRPSRLPPSMSDYDYVRELVRRNAAIVLDGSKDYLIETRLLPLARELNLTSVDALIARLRSQNPGAVHSRVVECLTTNETSFFRDVHPFEALKASVLPQLLKRNAGTRSLRIWSAACSTGQEVYSIAMTILDSFPELRTWNVQLWATDLNERVLERASSGTYRQLEVNRGLPAKFLVRYFRRVGPDWQVRPEVSALCQFRKLNLIGPWLGMPIFDVVFLRNVLIYFDLPARRDVLERVERTMSPAGYLFLGTGETPAGINEHFDRGEANTNSYFQLRAEGSTPC
jgi:chemotaxis protein methyltransferase CheR